MSTCLKQRSDFYKPSQMHAQTINKEKYQKGIDRVEHNKYENLILSCNAMNTKSNDKREEMSLTLKTVNIL